MISILFFLFAAVAIASAILMIVHRNPIYSALFLIITFFAIAGLYVLLNAPFIAAIHVIVYTGAIMVLFLFIIMLLDLSSAKEKRPTKKTQVFGVVLPILLFVELTLFIRASSSTDNMTPTSSVPEIVGSTAAIGTLLFTKYVFVFEIASVLLLSAIIGSVILSKRKLS